MTGPLAALHVVAGLAQRHGGPSISVPALARAQAAAGANVTLLSVAEPGETPGERTIDGVREIREAQDFAGAPLAGALRLSRGFARRLAVLSPSVDVLHNHGLWLWPNIAAARAARAARKPLVLAPRGMLAPEALAFSRRRKMLVWRLAQGPALRGLACVHATSAAEGDEARAFGLDAPVAVAPNGVDVPDIAAPRPTTPDGRREALYLGRIHPKKGLDLFVRVWADAPAALRATWRLRVIGPDEDGEAARIVALARRLGLNEAEMRIEPPVYGVEKFAAYRRADLFVLPTRNENFGMSVAEALAAGTPALVTRGAPWAGLDAERCGWWVSRDENALRGALEAALSSSRETLAEMGRRGRAWMARDFGWDAAAADMLAVYAWLRDGGERPACVQAGRSGHERRGGGSE